MSQRTTVKDLQDAIEASRLEPTAEVIVSGDDEYTDVGFRRRNNMLVVETGASDKQERIDDLEELLDKADAQAEVLEELIEKLDSDEKPDTDIINEMTNVLKSLRVYLEK